MIFKKRTWIQWALSFLFLTLSFSCSDFLKGKPKKQDVIEIKKETLSCLKDVSSQFKLFLKSEMTEKQVDSVFSCLDSTLNEFQSRIEGGVEATSFTADELFQIFDKFLNEAQVSQEAAKDLLSLKAAILGGSEEKITKKEISELRKYLVLLKTEAKSLLPYASLFKLKKEKTSRVSKKLMQDGFAQLNLSLKNLMKASQISRSEYQFSDLQKLIINLKILDEDQAQFLKLAQLVKDLLAGPQILRAEADYSIFIDNLTEVLRLYSLQAQDYIKFEIENPDDMASTVEYIQDWIQLLENSLQYKKTKMISVETLDPVIKEINEKGLVPVKIQSDTLLTFYKTLLIRVFQPARLAELSSFVGLNQSYFSSLKREIALFNVYLNAIKSIPTDSRIKLFEAQNKLKAYQINFQSAELKKFDEPTQKVIKEAFEDLRSEFLASRPVIYRFKKMIIGANQDTWDQNWADLARAVYVKFLARELLLGWGNASSSKNLASSSISEPGLVQWYSDFKKFGIEVKSFDPRSNNAGAVSFKQANLLTYAGDGDDKLNFLETVQYLNMLLSGGGQSLSEMQSGFEKASCQLPDPKDVFDNPWNDEVCVMKDLRANFKNYFSTLPYLVEYTSALNDKQFFDFYLAAMDITRIDKKYTGKKVETADLRAMSILFYYIEALYAQFDINQNRTFSDKEIRSSYPRFKNFAKKYAYDNAKTQIDEFNGVLAQTIGGYGCYNEDDLIRESFVFLVYNGQAPKKSDLNLVPCLGRRALIDFSGEVDRKTIINTFKILKAVLGS